MWSVESCAGFILCLLCGLWLSTEPPPSSSVPTQYSRMLNRLKAIFHSEPFNRALYSMSVPGQFPGISPSISGANPRFCPGGLAEVTPEVATFAGGCFWGVEHIFLKHYPPSENKGILKTAVGYTGGNTNDPNYREVCSGSTNHAEALRIEFDPKIVTYAELVGEYPRALEGGNCD